MSEYEGSLLEDEEFGYDEDLADESMPSKRMSLAPWASYRTLTRSDIIAFQSSRIADLCEVLPTVCQDEAFLLLVKFGWNVGRVQEQWFDQGEKGVKESAGIFSTELAGGLSKCLICLEEDLDCVGMDCLHWACVACLGNYFASQAGDGSVILRCFGFRCMRNFPPSIVARFVPEDKQKQLVEWGVRNFVGSDPDRFKFCPSACDLVVEKLARANNSAVLCGCGFSWCWACGGESHAPASCEQARLWTAKNSSESENVGWIMANTKPCPKCHRPIEKNQGCNHMTCPVSKGGCGTDFCWMCLSPWSKHGGAGFYSCNIYVEATDEEKLTRKNAKTALDKYMFFFDRFVNHGKAAAVAKKQLAEVVPQQMQRLHDELALDMTELGFLEEALAQVIKCRQVLKWSYVLGFYQEMELFAHAQKNLEEFTDRLHEFIEKDLVERFVPEDGAERPTERRAFLEFRSQVCNYTAVIGNFCASIAR